MLLASLDGVSPRDDDRKPEFRFPDFFDGPTFLSVLSPVAEEPRSARFAALALALLLQQGYRRFTDAGPRPVLLALDEAARLGARLNLDEVVSYSSGAGLVPVIALQDLAQVQPAAHAHSGLLSTLASNAGTMIALGGVSPATVAGFTSRLGTVDVPYEDRSVSNWYSFSPTETRSRRFDRRAALGDREITAPPFGPRTALVHARAVSHLPFVVDLTRRDPRPHSV